MAPPAGRRRRCRARQRRRDASRHRSAWCRRWSISRGSRIGRLLLATSRRRSLRARFVGALPRADARSSSTAVSLRAPRPGTEGRPGGARHVACQGIVQLGADHRPTAVVPIRQRGLLGRRLDGAAAAQATSAASEAILVIALGALGLGAVVSLWLARVVARPIDHLSQQLRRHDLRA